MNDTVVFITARQESVPKEVVKFLEKARKRVQARATQDKGHLNRSEPETVLSNHVLVEHLLEQSVLWNFQLEHLRNAVAKLNAQKQELISLRYNGDLSMEGIRKVFGVSKIAVSKRLKKLHAKLKGSVQNDRVSQFFPVYKLSVNALKDEGNVLKNEG